MNTSANPVMGMNQRHLRNDPSRRAKGLVIVIALHLLMGYALVSGMARKGLNLITKPLEPWSTADRSIGVLSVRPNTT